MTKPKITPTTGDLMKNGGMGAPFVLPIRPSTATQPQPGPLKVAIIGTAPSSRMLAPFGDQSWTIWACSPGNMNILPRFDAWFELHGNLLWPENRHYGEPYVNFLRALSCPVYMQDQSMVPQAITFPMREMVKEFGRDFFSSSFAWMMAYAMHLGAQEVALFGVDMASKDEYIQQRPGFYYFKREAERRGVKISAPYESDIMQSPGLYGYSDVMPFGRKVAARRQELAVRLQHMKPERDKLQQNITYLEGASEDIDYFQAIWSGLADDMALLRTEKYALEQENASLKLWVAKAQEAEEQRRKQDVVVPMEGANGGQQDSRP